MDCSLLNVANQAAPVMLCKESSFNTIAAISAIVGAYGLIFTVITYWQNRRIAQNKATIDLIFSNENSDHFKGNNLIFSHHRENGGFDALVHAQTGDERTKRKAVADYLNHYELIALGIRRGVLNSGFYRKWMGTVVLRDWNAAQPFVAGERQKVQSDGSSHTKAYDNLEWLAEKKWRD